MQIDWWTLGLQAVNALVLVWLLAHFLFRPVVDAIGARQKAAGQVLADAPAAQAEADKLRAAAKAEIEAERRSEAFAAEDRAGRLAIDIATKLLDRLPEEARRRRKSRPAARCSPASSDTRFWSRSRSIPN